MVNSPASQNGPRTTQGPDIVLLGHPFAPSGTGENLRCTFRALTSVGAQPRLRDIYGIAERNDPSYEAEFADHLTSGLSGDINIFQINGDEIEHALAHLDDPRFATAYNIVYPTWELSTYPEAWARQLERFAEIWAPSQFIQNAIIPAVARPVIHVPLGVETQLRRFLGRRAFGVPDFAFVFLAFVDLTSDITRKNPFGMIEAFLKVCDRLPDAPLHCVLKYKGGDQDHPDRARLEKLLAAHADRVQTLTQTLDHDEKRNLIRCADCFVSLHRSEGFGSEIAEAMALGRAVIATGYSGNMDFMTSETSYPVASTLVPVEPEAYPYGAGQVWADPSINHAVSLMERVYSDRCDRELKANAARRHMRTHFSSRATGLRYLDRIAAIGAARISKAE